MSAKNEKFYNFLLEGFQLPSFLHQKIENDILLINYNTAAKEMTHDNISKIFENKPEIIMDLQQCINEQTNFCKEISYQIVPTGEIKYYNFRYSFIHPDLILMSVEDITERKKAEDALKLSQEKLKRLNLELEQKVEKRTKELKESKEEIKRERDNITNILDSMEDMIYIVNQNYKIEYANPSMIRTFGVLKDQKCFEYTNERSEPCPTCKIPEVLNEKTIRSEWYSNKNQGLYDVVDTPLRQSDGSITKLRIFRDITNQKNLEKELKASREKIKRERDNLTNILDSMEDMIYIVNQNYKIEYANP
ncbi:MAG: PAS domain-containing protein, partial [Candidatus Hermodarchaeota archaeon]